MVKTYDSLPLAYTKTSVRMVLATDSHASLSSCPHIQGEVAQKCQTSTSKKCPKPIMSNHISCQNELSNAAVGSRFFIFFWYRKIWLYVPARTCMNWWRLFGGPASPFSGRSASSYTAPLSRHASPPGVPKHIPSASVAPLSFSRGECGRDLTTPECGCP